MKSMQCKCQVIRFNVLSNVIWALIAMAVFGTLGGFFAREGALPHIVSVRVSDHSLIGCSQKASGRGGACPPLAHSAITVWLPNALKIPEKRAWGGIRRGR